MAGYIGKGVAGIASVSERKKVFTATAGQTAFTPPGGYTVGSLHVFQNGIRLVDGTDYTATDGTTVTLTNGAQVDDEVVIIAPASYRDSDSYTKAEINAGVEVDELQVANGTGTITISAPDSDTDRAITLPDSAGEIFVGDIASADLPAGSVLQVVQSAHGAKNTYTSASFTDYSQLTATITPTSTSSKILVCVALTLGTGNNSYSFARLVRGSTVVGVGDTKDNRNVVSFSLSGDTTMYTKADTRAWQYLDSPATTSATTYKIQVKTSQSVMFNATGEDENSATTGLRALSTITLMEIAG